jgi:peptidoglycan biosynthesis protein MviN/MurJ (putative lipid II flippase)
MTPKPLIGFATALLLTPATAALAQTGARQDHSQFLTWGFLGMCALIIILQLVPVFTLAFGLVKGLFQGKDEIAKEVAVRK